MEGVNQSNARQTTMDITTLGIDVSKNSFHVIGTNRAGKPIFRQKFTRAKLAEFAANHPPCLIGMEACPGSQHLARKFEEFGHDGDPRAVGSISWFGLLRPVSSRAATTRD
jgi:hypothetical protein